jgi:ketosteroid isomerase-like protein
MQDRCPSKTLRSSARRSRTSIRGGVGFRGLHLAPSVVYHEDPAWPEAGVYEGRDAVIAYHRGIREQFDVDLVEIEDLREACDGVVLALMHERITGKSGGAPAELHFGFVWTIRDGMIVHVRAYLDRDEALRAIERVEGIVAHMRALYAGYNRRDWDALFAELDPGFVWDPVEENVSYRGRSAITEYFERWLDAWVEFRAEPERIEVAPDCKRMLLSARYTGTVKASDIPIEGLFYQVIELRDDVPVQGKEFVDEAQARAAFERPE